MRNICQFLVIFVFSLLEWTECVFVSVGYYPDYESNDINLKQCGLRYYPRDIHQFHYSSKCFGNPHEIRSFVDYSEPERKRKPDSTSERIFQGIDTEVGEAPFTVYLAWIQIPWAEVAGAVCTGSLITFEWVLTAAHCFSNSSFGDRFLRLGTPYVMAGSKSRFGDEKIEANSEKLVIHPKYANKRQYDLALIKLKAKFTRHKNNRRNYLINTICLPETRQWNKDYENVTVFGFGRTTDNIGQRVGLILPLLKRADMRAMPSADRHQNSLITENWEKPSICEGDSGGPLVQYVDGQRNRAVLVGVSESVSGLDAPCDENNDFNYFTTVSRSVEWILKTISEN